MRPYQLKVKSSEAQNESSKILHASWKIMQKILFRTSIKMPRIHIRSKSHGINGRRTVWQPFKWKDNVLTNNVTGILLANPSQ